MGNEPLFGRRNRRFFFARLLRTHSMRNVLKLLGFRKSMNPGNEITKIHRSRITRRSPPSGFLQYQYLSQLQDQLYTQIDAKFYDIIIDTRRLSAAAQTDCPIDSGSKFEQQQHHTATTTTTTTTIPRLAKGSLFGRFLGAAYLFQI